MSNKETRAYSFTDRIMHLPRRILGELIDDPFHSRAGFLQIESDEADVEDIAPDTKLGVHDDLAAPFETAHQRWLVLEGDPAAKTAWIKGMIAGWDSDFIQLDDNISSK